MAKAQPIPVPTLVVLGHVINQAEQAMESQSGSSTPPWPLYLLLPPGSRPTRVPALTSISDAKYKLKQTVS